MTDQTPGGIETVSEAPGFAYMLLTHKDPHHVEELASRILDLSPAGHVVIHHDLAADDLPWQGRPPDRVHFVERGRVLWGDRSIVAATLRMIRFAYQDLGADWFVMLSGEHRPVVDLRQWEHSIMASGADAFSEAEALSPTIHFGRSGEDANRFLARCLHRWVTVKEPHSAIGNKVFTGLWRMSRYVLPFCAMEYAHRRHAWFVGLPRRRGRPEATTFYKGTQWIGFNRRSAEAVMGTDPAVTEWFKRSHIPDETYLQTVLHNAPGLNVSNDLVTFVPESPLRPSARWMVLSHEDLPIVWRSEAAFARKVDPDERPDVIKAIDEKVETERRSRGVSQTKGPAA
jgi:Core-2/I-Branching enzyme